MTENKTGSQEMLPAQEIPVSLPHELKIARPPEEILGEAQKAAAALKAVIMGKAEKDKVVFTASTTLSMKTG
jgi:hypothetical protein